MIGVVVKKELRDGLRDRRSLMSALLFGPLIGPMVFALLLGFTLREQEKEAEKPLVVPVLGQANAPNLVAHLKRHGVEIEEPPADPERAVREEQVELVLVIPETFGPRFTDADPAEVTLIVDRSRRSAGTTITRLRGLLSAYGREIGALRLQLRGVDPSISAAVVVAEKDLSTPQSRGANILSMLPYFMIIAVFIGSMYIAIDSTAGERERKSLEPLLINPVPRWHLMTGKLVATVCLGVTSLLLTIVAFSVASRFIPAARLGLELKLDFITGLMTFLVILPVSVLIAAVQIIISAFTKSFREAQTYVSILLLVPMLPSFFLMVSPVKSQLWMATVPVLSQNLLIEKLVRGEGVDPLFFGVAAACTAAAGGLLAWISARLYDRESLLF